MDKVVFDFHHLFNEINLGQARGKQLVPNVKNFDFSLIFLLTASN